VSFDDGGYWQPLQLNLPVSPIHDLIVKDDDLVVATHGRSFWVLDDLTPLRQLDPAAQVPRCACIVRTAYHCISPRREPTPAVGDNPPGAR